MKSKIENIEIFGVKHAIKGLRKSWNSISQSDTIIEPNGLFKLGKNDLKLMSKLVNKSGSHRKFLRCIHIQFDALFPLYWWKQFDQYKVGTTTLSTSTMHTLGKLKSVKVNMFDVFLEDLNNCSEKQNNILNAITELIDVLDNYLEMYKRTKDKDYWKMLIKMLPSSFLQDRTVDTNLETIHRIIKDRKNHKLKEWNYFIEKMLENKIINQILGETCNEQ